MIRNHATENGYHYKIGLQEDGKFHIDCVQRWYKEHGLNRALFVKQFKDQITGRLMLDCAFQYGVYWDEVAKRREK